MANVTIDQLRTKTDKQLKAFLTGFAKNPEALELVKQVIEERELKVEAGVTTKPKKSRKPKASQDTTNLEEAEIEEAEIVDQELDAVEPTPKKGRKPKAAKPKPELDLPAKKGRTGRPKQSVGADPEAKLHTKKAVLKNADPASHEVDDTPDLELESIPEALTSTELKKFGKNEPRAILIDPKIIKVRAHFNVRTDFGDIEGLAESIHANGLLVPLRGDMTADGEFILTDGHRRNAALQLLATQGIKVKQVPAIVNDKHTTEEDRIVSMFVTQDNLPLNDLEKAELMRRLVKLKWTTKEIAKRLGCSPVTVGNYLAVAKMDKDVKLQILSGKMSMTKALMEKREERAIKSGKKSAWLVFAPLTDADTGKEVNFQYKFTSKNLALAAARCLIQYMAEMNIESDKVLVKSVEGIPKEEPKKRSDEEKKAANLPAKKEKKPKKEKKSKKSKKD